MKRISAIISALLMLAAFPESSPAQVFPDFSKLNFGCDGDSITSGDQWSVTTVSLLGSAEEALKGKSLDEVDVTTMAGGARWAIQTIIERFPQCRVFVCTPIQTSNPEHNIRNSAKIEILKEICRSLSVNLIDCYGECGISEKLEDGHGHRYLLDGLHPGMEGQKLMGRYIAKEIRNNTF